MKKVSGIVTSVGSWSLLRTSYRRWAHGRSSVYLTRHYQATVTHCGVYYGLTFFWITQFKSIKAHFPFHFLNLSKLGSKLLSYGLINNPFRLAMPPVVLISSFNFPILIMFEIVSTIFFIDFKPRNSWRTKHVLSNTTAHRVVGDKSFWDLSPS